MTAAPWLLAAALAAEPAAPLLRIVSPEEGAPVGGTVTVRIEAHPSVVARVRRMALRVDGQPLCTREAPPFECEWEAGRRGGIHVIRAAADLRDGGRIVVSMRTAKAPLPPQGRLTLPAAVKVVQVPATVVDERGRFVPGLTADAFRLYEDGAPQQVTHLLGEGVPRQVVVAVDISGSMAGAMPELKRAVRSFLAAQRRDDNVTLVAFNDAVFTLARWESDAAARLRAAERLAPWGGTALFDALVGSFDLLARRHGRKVLVVFTDGEDQSSRAALEDVQKRAETNDAAVYMIGQGRATRDRKLKDVLVRLAAMSGGRAFNTAAPADLDGVFREIVEELENQYLLGYQPANLAEDGSWREIRVEVAGARHRVRARQGYRALPQRKEPGE